MYQRFLKVKKEIYKRKAGLLHHSVLCVIVKNKFRKKFLEIEALCIPIEGVHSILYYNFNTYLISSMISLIYLFYSRNVQ